MSLNLNIDTPTPKADLLNQIQAFTSDNEAVETFKAAAAAMVELAPGPLVTLTASSRSPDDGAERHFVSMSVNSFQ